MPHIYPIVGRGRFALWIKKIINDVENIFFLKNAMQYIKIIIVKVGFVKEIFHKKGMTEKFWM